MVKVTKHIEIVASSKRGLSSMGPKTRMAIQAVLLKRYARVDVTIVNDLSDLMALAARKPDLVFLGMKFIPTDPALGLADPNKIWLSEYLDNEGIGYTGSSHEAIELELSKELAKQRLANVGLKTARFKVIRVGDKLLKKSLALDYPLFVKPTNRGGGIGVDAGSLITNFRQLQSKVQLLAANLQSDALVEEYLPGREFSVGILKQLDTDRYSIMPLELVAPPDTSGARFLSSQVKSADAERTLEIADPALRAAVSALALDAFHALGAQDYGRIDIRLDAGGTPHFLEANLLPCLTENYGNFPRMCLMNLGLRHESMILNIVDLAFARQTIADISDPEEITIHGLITPLTAAIS